MFNTTTQNKGFSSVFKVVMFAMLVFTVVSIGVVIPALASTQATQAQQVSDTQTAQDQTQSVADENASVLTVYLSDGESHILLEDTLSMLNMHAINAPTADGTQQTQLETLSQMDRVSIDITYKIIDWSISANFETGETYFSETLSEEELETLQSDLDELEQAQQTQQD